MRYWHNQPKLTRALVAGLSESAKRPRVLVSASAIGIYGSRGDEILIEASAPGVCQKLIKVWAFCFNAADLVRVFSRDLKSALLSHAAQIVELGFGMLVNG